MIVFDLRCGAGHVFEAWFASSATYEAQREAGDVRCPLCGVTEVAKAVMAPAIPSKGNRRAAMPSPAAVKAALALLATQQAAALEKSEWVGGSFANRARAMHLGEEPDAAIHGQATAAEAKALVEDGVPIAPLPLPIVPPKTVN
ncbi:MAG TPA: DUF1178 family protein [Sphingomonas sp.]|nr:DUF1178 family protein [Sphingomonas sp.]